MAYKLEKINELIRQELSGILLREEEFGEGVLATILSAETTEDQKETTVTISVWPDTARDSVMKKLNAHIWPLQQLLNKRLKIHPVPKVRFEMNTDEATSQQVDELIQKIKQEEAND